ncbi:MAG: Hpt domain-containing protein [Candidatus Polarisedimenticolaceae bacterium]|nr:Hpt domain-containing protein [Candidatus Polarisedimenticolaceae bacterium]
MQKGDWDVPFCIMRSKTRLDANDPDIIDIGILNQLLNSNPKKVEKFIHLFLQLADESLTEIKEAQQKKEFKQLNFLGHRLKSQACTVGALRLGDLCQELEMIDANSTPSEINSLISELNLLLKQIGQRLQQNGSIPSPADALHTKQQANI